MYVDNIGTTLIGGFQFGSSANIFILIHSPAAKSWMRRMKTNNHMMGYSAALELLANDHQRLWIIIIRYMY